MLPPFRGNLLGTSSRVILCLTIEDGTDRFYRNVDNKTIGLRQVKFLNSKHIKKWQHFVCTDAEIDEIGREHDVTAVREISPSLLTRRLITTECDTDVSTAVIISQEAHLDAMDD